MKQGFQTRAQAVRSTAFYFGMVSLCNPVTSDAEQSRTQSTFAAYFLLSWSTKSVNDTSIVSSVSS
ncbi:hypothetical protein ABIC94_003955 [Variovorax paradoxus]